MAWEQQVVGVSVPAGGGEHHVGTGYLITPQRVVTARHVVQVGSAEQGPQQILVRLAGVRAAVVAHVVWDSDALDIAVLDCAAPPRVSGFWAAPLATRAGSTANKPWKTLGYPREHKSLQGFRHSLQGGTVMGLQDGKLVLRAEAQPAAWSGISGAPVFVQGRLVGFICSEPRGYQNRLEAVSMEALLKVAGFCDAAAVEQADAHCLLVDELEKVVADERVARALRKRLFLKEDLRARDLAEAIVAQGRRDTRELSESLLTAITQIQRDREDWQALRERPFTRILQLALPLCFEAAFEDGHGAEAGGVHISHDNSAAFIEARMASHEGRRAYWVRQGQAVTGRNFLLAGEAEWGIAPYQHTLDLARAVAERVDAPLSLDRNAPPEEVDRALVDLDGRLAQLRRLVQRAPDLWEETCHAFYAVVVEPPGTDRPRPIVDDLRTRLGHLPVVLNRPDRELFVYERDMERCVGRILEIEDQPVHQE